MTAMPIIALTAHVMSGEREDVLSQGLDDYLAKPVDRTELSQCLARWLPVAERTTPATQLLEDDACKPAAETLITQGILQQLLEDVGSKMAPQVIASFIQELQDQTTALQTASSGADLIVISANGNQLGLHKVASRLVVTLACVSA